VAASVQNRRVTRYPVIRLAKLALWVLQDDRVASAWRSCDNHVCGAVAISAGEKKTEKKRKIGRNRDTSRPLGLYGLGKPLITYNYYITNYYILGLYRLVSE
jgi:hypothetical protein